MAGIARAVVPTAVALTGFVLLATRAGDALGIAFIGVGLVVAAWNALLRLSLAGETERDRDQRDRGRRRPGDGRPHAGR